jgi:hypothetical protein
VFVVKRNEAAKQASKQASKHCIPCMYRMMVALLHIKDLKQFAFGATMIIDRSQTPLI